MLCLMDLLFIGHVFRYQNTYDMKNKSTKCNTNRYTVVFNNKI